MDELLTVPEVLAKFRVPRSTWYQWRQTGRAPRVFKLPNGELRVRRSVFEDWLTGLESEAA
ncbi:excisionase [Actinoplanes italicus]|uniref:AlpA family transcriptional regulator n=1 Tax=Actinoplanes italicus TaxID=113567 RepID=A0A2T0KQB1_9ACTN|nr:helix-turn-helix domain-containing protein [Actinoplanes italicus]PRX25927.1 AlpA family transcriptional regulator [Actinoplanes italicus]GIE33511.1 excisionase [Actinoplanes italicus]